MLLRDHPLMSYRVVRSWPPIWTWTDGRENKRPRGEIGILREYCCPTFNPPTSASYTSIMKTHHIGCLVFVWSRDRKMKH